MYLIDVVGVGSSALQEHRRDPHVDESAMSSERHKQQIALSIIAISTIAAGRTATSSVSQHYRQSRRVSEQKSACSKTKSDRIVM